MDCIVAGSARYSLFILFWGVREVEVSSVNSVSFECLLFFPAESYSQCSRKNIFKQFDPIENDRIKQRSNGFTL